MRMGIKAANESIGVSINSSRKDPRSIEVLAPYNLGLLPNTAMTGCIAILNRRLSPHWFWMRCSGFNEGIGQSSIQWSISTSNLQFIFMLPPTRRSTSAIQHMISQQNQPRRAKASNAKTLT